MGFTGIVVGPVKTRSVVPSIIVNDPGKFVGKGPRAGTVIGPGMIRYGVPFMVVVLAPGRPLGARESGIEVAEGNIR